MIQPDNYDVAIIGGGMAGLSQCLSLSGLGLRVVLLDSQSPPPPVADLQAVREQPQFASRVSALTPASIALLERLGVWQRLQSLRVSPYYDMEVWDSQGSGQIHFSANDLHSDCLGYIVENLHVVSVLAEAAAQKDDCSLFYQQQLSTLNRGAGFWEIETEAGKKLGCSLLIGADGAFSQVRELTGLKTREWSYQQQALVCTVLTEKPHRHTARQCFLPTGPLAFLPLQLPGAEEQHYCSIVWSCDEDKAAELSALNQQALAKHLAQGLEGRLGSVQLCSEPLMFPLTQRHARDYVADGVALVGDAAHTIHPLAGQGINLGLSDVDALACVIQKAVTRKEKIESLQVLSRYQRQRKPENLAMMLGMEGFKQAFGSDDLLLRYLRNQGLNLANRLGPLKHALMRKAMGLNA